MATVTVSFDTVSKQATVSVDGAEVQDVDGFSLSKMHAGQFWMELTTRKNDQANGTWTTTRLMASKDGVIAPAAPGDGPIPDLTPELLKAVASRYAARK